MSQPTPRPSDHTPSPPRVLLALPPGVFPGAALRRALALAHAQGYGLHVLRAALPAWTALQWLRRTLRRGDDDRVPRQRTHAAQTRAWLDAALRPGGEPVSLEVVSGDFERRVVERAHALEVELVVLPGELPGVGRMATTVARATDRPVLVARTEMPADLIVAASDLKDEAYPVLRAAAALAGRLEATVVAVHNVAPPPVIAEPDPILPVAREVSAELASHRQGQLQDVVTTLDISAEAVVSQRPSDGEAILREARARHADLVVVGTRAPTLFNTLRRWELAADVAQRALRSVLVLPLDTPGRWAPH